MKKMCVNLQNEKWSIRNRMLFAILAFLLAVTLIACGEVKTDNLETVNSENSEEEVISADDEIAIIDGEITDDETAIIDGEITDDAEAEDTQEVQPKIFTEEELTLKMYQFVCKDGYEDKKYWDYYVCDSQGRIIQGVIYKNNNDSREKTWCYDWEYDDNGKLVNEKYYNFQDGKIRDLQEVQFKYDENGNIVKGERVQVGKVYATLEYEYDENRNIVKMSESDSEGTKLRWEEYEYDDNRNVIKSAKYEHDSLWLLTDYTYDKAGRVVKIIKQDSYEKPLTRIFYEYDEQGNMIEEFIDYVNRSKDLYSYEYDNQGNMVKKIGYDSWEEYIYDNNGKLIKYAEHYNSRDEYGWSECGYDTSGRREETRFMNSNGNNFMIQKYGYDEQGKLVSCEDIKNDN